MVELRYLDPYKDDPFGKIRGDKANTYFEVHFDEGKIYEEEAIIIAVERH